MRARRSKPLLLTALLLSVILAACGTAPATRGTAPTAAPVASENAPTAVPAAAVPTAATESAPTAAATTSDATTITYFTFSAAPDHLKDLDAMIAAFKKANPTIDVKVETALYADYFTELQTLVAGDTAPDVFELNYENFVTYASKGVLADMTPMASAQASFADKFYPKAYAAFSRDGKQYGLPQSFSDVVLYYNKDLFDKAGVSYPTESWTWKDELAAAQKLTDTSTGVWGTYAPIQFFEFYKTAAQSGYNVFGADGKTVTINQPGCVESLTWMTDKINKYKVTPTDADMAGVSDGDLFKQGKIAMLRTGIWMFAAFDVRGVQGCTVQVGHCAGAGQHPESPRLLCQLGGNLGQEQAAGSHLEVGAVLHRYSEAAKIRVAASWELPALNDQALFDSYLKQTPPETRAVVFKALDTAVTPPVIEQQSQLQDAVGKVLDEAKAGTITPQEALDQAKTAVEALVK